MENYEFFHDSTPAAPGSCQPACWENHKKNWKIFQNGEHAIFYYIPANAVFSADGRAGELLSRVSQDFCFLCDLEESTPIRKRPAQVTSIKSIALNVIEKCNMRCSYCFAGEGDYGFASKMSPETAKKTIEFFTRESSSLHIVFFGGEPLLNFSLIESVVGWCESLHGKTFTYGITTNGVLLSEKILDFFKRHRFSVKISYDGPLLQGKQRKLAHSDPNAEADYLTTKLRKMSESLANLRGLKLRATCSKENLSLVFQNLLSMLNSFQYRVAFARVSKAGGDLAFTREDCEKLGEILCQLVDYLSERREYENLMRLYPVRTYIDVFHRGEFHRNFCGAGLDYLSVSTTGGFYLCHRFTEDREESLGDLENGWNHRKLAEISRLRQAEAAPCSGCWMRQMCAGGCFHEHKTGRGSIDRVDPVFCQLQEAEVKQALKAYVEIRQNAPGLLDRTH